MTLFRDIVEGLSFLHGRNILHLDLKVRLSSSRPLALPLLRLKRTLTHLLFAARRPRTYSCTGTTTRSSRRASSATSATRRPTRTTPSAVSSSPSSRPFARSSDGGRTARYRSGGELTPRPRLQEAVRARSSTPRRRRSSPRRTRATCRRPTERPTCGRSVSSFTSCATLRCRTRAPRATTRPRWRTRSSATPGASRLLFAPAAASIAHALSRAPLCRSFHPFVPLPPAAAARHDLPPSLLALLQALVHRSPTRRPLCERVLRAVDGVRVELKHGWRSAARNGEGEEVVLAAPRGRWGAGQSFSGERPPLWRPQRGRSVSRLESARLGDRAVEVEVEEPESRDESEWRVSPSVQVRVSSFPLSSFPGGCGATDLASCSVGRPRAADPPTLRPPPAPGPPRCRHFHHLYALLSLSHRRQGRRRVDRRRRRRNKTSRFGPSRQRSSDPLQPGASQEQQQRRPSRSRQQCSRCVEMSLALSSLPAAV